MKKIEDCTQELINCILESEEYQNFIRLRDKVRENEELRSQINDFRLHIFETQNSKDLPDMYAEQERLCREYEEFRKNSLVNDFLQAELRVCRILQSITADITDALDLDLDKVAERIHM